MAVRWRGWLRMRHGCVVVLAPALGACPVGRAAAKRVTDQLPPACRLARGHQHTRAALRLPHRAAAAHANLSRRLLDGAVQPVCTPASAVQRRGTPAGCGAAGEEQPGASHGTVRVAAASNLALPIACAMEQSLITRCQSLHLCYCPSAGSGDSGCLPAVAASAQRRTATGGSTRLADAAPVSRGGVRLLLIARCIKR